MKNKEKENYLEKIPLKNSEINWTEDSEDIVTLEIENKGTLKKITQKLFKKPKVSYIHLDEFGSFVWKITDGESDIIELGKKVSERFGDSAEPLYERLAKFYQILESHGFVNFL